MTKKCSRDFLSGEADKEIQFQREARLSNLMKGVSLSEAEQTAKEEFGVPRVQVLQEPVSTRSDGSTTKEQNGLLQNELSDDESPPPLFVDPSSTGESNLMPEHLQSLSATLTLPAMDQPARASRRELPSLMEQMIEETTKVQATKEEHGEKLQQKGAKSVKTGMKRGFLLSSKKNKKNNRITTHDDSSVVHSIQKKKTDTDADTDTSPTIWSDSNISNSSCSGLELPEVQEAMREQLGPLEKGEWVTPGFLDKLSSNPRLTAAMKDPKFMAALRALQENPQKAMKRFQADAEISSLLREMCGILGSHFTELGAATAPQTEPKTSDVGSTITAKGTQRKKQPAISPELQKEIKMKSGQDQQKVDAVLKDSQLRELLMDTDLQRVMRECGMPGRMHMYLNHPEYGPKLRKLMQAGLLQVASRNPI